MKPDLAAIVSEIQRIASSAVDGANATRIGDLNDAQCTQLKAALRRLANQLHSVSDRLEALHSQAQEREGWVPVAMRIVLPRGSTTGWEDYDDSGRVEALRNNGWTVRIAYAAAPTGGSET